MQDPQYPAMSLQPDAPSSSQCAVAEMDGWHLKIRACRDNDRLFWKIESDGLVELYAPEVKVECSGNVQLSAKSVQCQVETAVVEAEGHVQISAKSVQCQVGTAVVEAEGHVQLTAGTVTCRARDICLEADALQINADVQINGILHVHGDVIHDEESIIQRLHAIANALPGDAGGAL